MTRVQPALFSRTRLFQAAVRALFASRENLRPLFHGGFFVVLVAFVGQREGGAAALACRFSAIGPHIAGTIAIMMVLLRLLLLNLKLSGIHEAEIVLGMLEIVLGHHPVACGVRIPGELEIFFVNMGGRATNLDLRSRRIEGSIGIVLRPTAASA